MLLPIARLPGPVDASCGSGRGLNSFFTVSLVSCLTGALAACLIGFLVVAFDDEEGVEAMVKGPCGGLGFVPPQALHLLRLPTTSACLKPCLGQNSLQLSESDVLLIAALVGRSQ